MEGIKQCPRCECRDVPMDALICPFCGYEFEKAPAPKPREGKRQTPPESAGQAAKATVMSPSRTEGGAGQAGSGMAQVIKPTSQAGVQPRTAQQAGQNNPNDKTYRKKHGLLKFVIVVVLVAFVWMKFLRPSKEEDGGMQSSGAADVSSTSFEDADSDGQMAGDGGTNGIPGYTAQATVIGPDGVKIRQEASVGSDMVGVAEKGEVLGVLGVVQGPEGYTWYQVQVNDTTTGYIRADLVEVAGDIGENVEGGTEGEGEASAPVEAPAQFVLPLSDQVYLTREDIEGLSPEELRIARNEIYARHGRLFKDEGLQAYFNGCDWYAGSILPDDFSDSVFNEYERANKDLIVSYEHELGVNGQ